MKKIRDSLQKLVIEGAALKDQISDEKHLNDKESEVFFRNEQRWLLNSKTVLAFSQTRHLDSFNQIESSCAHPAAKMAMLIGILDSALDSIEDGFIGNIRHLLHANLFGNIIEQAEELLKAGHTIPAAVLGRIVIEEWLRDLSEKEGIPNHDSDKASILNDELKKRNVFALPRWRQIQGFLDVGNSAAHGKIEEFNESDVRRVLDFEKNNCI
jgi:hypothetical protein